MTSPSDSPATFSRHGGLWTDRLDAQEELQRRLASGAVAGDQGPLIHNWIRDGFVILEGAVSTETCEGILAEAEQAWAGAFGSVYCEHYVEGELRMSWPRPELRHQPHKLTNLQGECTKVREAFFAPRVMAFLRAVFEDDPLAMTTLLFERGTRQPIHQDTAFVPVEGSPLELCASWLALEDVREGSGELEYFVGSHRIPEIKFPGTDGKRIPAEFSTDPAYPLELHARCQAMGLRLQRFLPKRGDLLIWSADLVHGGRMDIEPEGTRKSLVTHYCPKRRDPGYFAEYKHSGKQALPSGGAVCWYEHPKLGLRNTPRS